MFYKLIEDTFKQTYTLPQRILSWEEEVRLSEKAKAGDKKAHDTLLLFNMRLVHKIAREFSSPSLEYEDLVGYGFLGLRAGINKFDPSRGVRISTYVGYWIKQSILRNMSEYGQLIHLPINMQNLKRQLTRLDMLALKPLSKDLQQAEKKLRHIEHIFANMASLDAPLGEQSLIEILENTSPTQNLEQVAIDTNIRNNLKTLLAKTLNPQEYHIIILRYGLFDHKALTLQKIGDNYNLSKERIRQIQARAEKKLRLNKQFVAIFKDIVN